MPILLSNRLGGDLKSQNCALFVFETIRKGRSNRFSYPFPAIMTQCPVWNQENLPPHQVEKDKPKRLIQKIQINHTQKGIYISYYFEFHSFFIQFGVTQFCLLIAQWHYPWTSRTSGPNAMQATLRTVAMKLQFM